MNAINQSADILNNTKHKLSSNGKFMIVDFRLLFSELLLEIMIAMQIIKEFIAL